MWIGINPKLLNLCFDIFDHADSTGAPDAPIRAFSFI
jgi:hypothetical protein